MKAQALDIDRASATSQRGSSGSRRSSKSSSQSHDGPYKKTGKDLEYDLIGIGSQFDKN